MDIKVGDIVKYTFPNPVSSKSKSVTGVVESLDEFYLVLLTEEIVRLKGRFKNFENLEVVKSSISSINQQTETDDAHLSSPSR
ncbi:MAG: hypothetical protein U5K00_06795 [Melioribacteraceae bacterium]|nr:hypothetical protein [Melioribacteraceae bacterium]